MKTILIPFFTVVSFFIFGIPCFSQYNSQFEEDVFKRFEDNNGNSYDLLNAINYEEGVYVKGRKQIDEHIRFLKSKNLHSKPLKKQIQTIYKSTHSKFFKKYDEKAFFNNIFENGNYNCVAASALYALIFDEFNINYSIRETPTHVYIIADTSGLQTLIESTLPGTGVVNFNERFKKDYIAYLNTNKIISDSEYENATVDELFRKHYSKDKTINLYELAALQYYNKGIFLFNDEKYSGSVSNFQKAYSIYPSNNIKYNHFVAIQNALYKEYNSKNYNGKLFGQLVQSSLEDSNLIQSMSDYFNDISQELCINSPDINRFNTFYEDFLSECPSEDVPVDIQHSYHYYKAYNYSVNVKYVSALSEIKKAYHLNKDNLLVKDLANNIGMKHMFIESRYKNQIDSMEHYFEELPFLIENKLFQQQYVYYFMKVISESFMYDEPEQGNEYYTRFIDALDKYDIRHYSEDHIAGGLGTMAFFNADNEEFSKAAQIVNKGLELAPESLKLKQLKSEIEQARQIARDIQRYKSNNTYNEIVYIDPKVEERESLNKNVNKYFPGKWKAVSIIMEDMEQDLTPKEVFEFDAEKNKNCTYSQNGKTEKGKWAYRMKSKCIYFVPNHDKDKYRVFKVKEVSSKKIVLLPYKDQKKPSPYKYVLKPVD